MIFHILPIVWGTRDHRLSQLLTTNGLPILPPQPILLPFISPQNPALTTTEPDRGFGVARSRTVQVRLAACIQARKVNLMTQDQYSDAADPIKDAASVMGSVAADLRDAAAQKFDETVSQVKSQANDAKANVASEVNDVAMALRRAAGDLRGGSAQERTLGQLANGLADASDAIRNKDLGEILDSVSKVARNNPALFLGGAVLLGFAASRYAKASSGGSAQPGHQEGGAYGFVANSPSNIDPNGAAP